MSHRFHDSTHHQIAMKIPLTRQLYLRRYLQPYLQLSCECIMKYSSLPLYINPTTFIQNRVLQYLCLLNSMSLRFHNFTYNQIAMKIPLTRQLYLRRYLQPNLQLSWEKKRENLVKIYLVSLIPFTAD